MNKYYVVEFYNRYLCIVMAPNPVEAIRKSNSLFNKSERHSQGRRVKTVRLATDDEITELARAIGKQYRVVELSSSLDCVC